ncbi:hypothetical protein LAZ67_20002582 [Cordylochernes scorpioides]|uniref:Reverse transcriptase domain-containing protein n=1 Tax=Cordylochernes scorpioides TaxID=51811 RepID=A0ABY6LN57_9ARAC|nr:hypothetical protein LAZ67_20002582 [Cordylochernes scorpioides]
MEGGKMEISNVFSVLADGQYEGEHDGVVSGDKSPANAEILAEITSKKNSTNSETLENYAKPPVTSGGNANFPQSSRNWADIVENDENFEQPKKRKRLLPSEGASQSLPGPSRQTKTTRDSTTPRQPSCPRNTIEQIKVSRQMLAQCRSKAVAGTYDQMTYLEFSPEFTQVDYIKALENKLGKGCVVQIGKASGQILVGFERPDMAETIIEDGLMIKGALLKALPYQKKAEKITISGLPFVIEDADIIRTLRPYCQVVSIAPTVNSSGGYTWLDLKKTAFILMNNGKKITDLPKKIIVTAKGGSALAYLEYGFRCSKCYRMGHKRMNCPRIIRETSTTQPLSQTSSVKTTAPAPNTTAAASPPATFSHPAPVAAPAQTSSAPPAQEDIALETEPTTRTPETSTQTDLNINRVENSSHHKIKDRSRSLSPKAGSTTQLQLDTLLERLPGSFFEEVTLLGLKEEEVKQAIVSLPHLRLLLGKLSVEQSLGLHTFNEKLIKGLGSSKSALYKRLSDIRTKTRSAQELPPCVIGQQVLSPGKIAAFDVTIRGSKATFVNCHLSHAPDERLQQLQVIAAAAVNEDARRSYLRRHAPTRDEAPLAVVAIDLESAFTTLDRGFLVSTLLSVGLPPVFVGWVLLLYAGAEAAARIEGIGRTPLFHMLNGVRQGCAASAAFFTISTGPLLLRLEQLLGRDNVLAYADDIVLLIREDGQLEVVRKIFEDFRRASGIRVNFGKSQGLWCGRWRNRTDSPSAISWNREKINILGTLVTPGMGTSAQDQHLQELLERAIARWSPFVRGLSLAGRAKAANSLVLSAIYYHLQAYLPSETTIGRLQARLARFVWGHDRTSWLPSSILARPISVGGMGLLDVGTQLRLSCLKGVQAALRGGRNAHSWFAESGMWLTPASTPGIWLPPRRRRSLHLFEPAAEILDLNHRILQPALLRALRVVGDCRFLRPPELLAPTRWLGWRIGELTGPAPNITIATRGALTDVAALGSFCTRLITQNARGRYRVDSLADAIVVRGTTTAFQRLTTRTARRLLERPRLAALPITQLFGRWLPHVSIPISISWSSLRRCAFSGHNADVAVRLALHALPHPAHPASARESCIACGSGDLSLAHRYWSCNRIRPVILEAFTILQRPPDLQSWIFGHDLEDDALSIMASAKTRIYKHFLGLEMRGVQEDPLLVWRRTLSRKPLGPKIIFGRNGTAYSTLTNANIAKRVR